MQFGFIKAAVGTPEIRVADCRSNAEAIIALIQRAKRDGAQLLSLPELCMTGYTAGDLFFQDALQRAAVAGLSTVLAASRDSDMVVVLGMPLATDFGLFNCGVVLQRGKLLGAVPKTVLPNYGEFYEKRFFSPAPDENTEIALCGQRVPFGRKLLFCCETMPELVIGIEICEDLWSIDPPSTKLVSHGATVICNLSASDEAVTKSDYRRTLVRVQSARLLCGYLFSSAGEGESTTDVVFSGHDMIFENGSKLAESPPFGAGYAVSEIDLGYLRHERRRLGFNATPSAGYQRVSFQLPLADTALTRVVWKTPFVADTQSERESRCDEVLAIQAHGLKKRISHTGVKRVVLGVSGGLDSSLALIVALRAMALLNRPAADVLAVTMPCFGTSSRTKNNAERLCDALGVPCRTIDIGAAVQRHLQDIGHAPGLTDAAFENAQARERTQVLMDLANMENALVIGTGDLSELALGFATYNGDQMSMYGVNAGVPKTLMRSMLSILGNRAGGELQTVLRDIIDTPVSPELLPAKDGEITQITEELVGPYELHDFFLYHMLRRGDRKDKILHLASYAFQGAYSREEIAHWLDVFYRRFFSQQFKRSCMPDGPRIGNVSLSPRGDWRMPSDASAAAWRE